jgi:hypothetical protein
MDREAALSPGNVPEPVSELIGRDDELREIPGRGKKLSGDHTFLGLGDAQ